MGKGADGKVLCIAMYPWFACRLQPSFLHLANKLAGKLRLDAFNHCPHLIGFIPIAVPHVDGLPPGSETTVDVHVFLHHLIITEID
ncbi:hypothetical protein MLD38_039910 [Melastoma candidum]|uniref:Uncharacterized protein n=1 Tax=Melastoma candidum TaxID=119954 RepID=A0ACB9L3I6_9MYRT|nr:hypothetical protein MLD38_039910 [Melastoma candidum]